MAEFLLDTNICSIALLGDIRIIQRLEAAGDRGIAISVITVGELVHMFEQLRDRTESLRKLTDFVLRFQLLPIDAETAEIYGQLKAAVFDRYAPKDRKQRRRTTIDNLGIGDNDLMRCSQCKELIPSASLHV